MCAFAFEPSVHEQTAELRKEIKLGQLAILPVRMNPDLAMGDELLKKTGDNDDIACWFIDTNYDGQSFFVRHAYFLYGGKKVGAAWFLGQLGKGKRKPAGSALTKGEPVA